MATKLNIKDFLRDNPPAKQFVPYVHLSRESDSLTAYFEGDADYSERLSDHVTVYRSLETNEVIGCRIKGISDLIDDLPNYIHVNHGGAELSVVFLAFRGGQSDGKARQAMNDLARAAQEKNMVLQSSLS
jgi:hypothetical protein